MPNEPCPWCATPTTPDAAGWPRCRRCGLRIMPLELEAQTPPPKLPPRCPWCHGTGRAPAAPERDCGMCDGNGQCYRPKATPPDALDPDAYRERRAARMEADHERAVRRMGRDGGTSR